MSAAGSSSSSSSAASTVASSSSPSSSSLSGEVSSSDLDRQIEQLRRCEIIKESEVKALCSKAREILVEESNVQRVDSPVTVRRIRWSMERRRFVITIALIGVRRHPRPVLRSEGALQSRRQRPGHQLSLHGRFRRSRLLLGRDVPSAARAQGKLSLNPDSPSASSSSSSGIRMPEADAFLPARSSMSFCFRFAIRIASL